MKKLELLIQNNWGLAGHFNSAKDFTSSLRRYSLRCWVSVYFPNMKDTRLCESINEKIIV